jgi:hypothetical protein
MDDDWESHWDNTISDSQLLEAAETAERMYLEEINRQAQEKTMDDDLESHWDLSISDSDLMKAAEDAERQYLEEKTKRASDERGKQPGWCNAVSFRHILDRFIFLYERVSII